MFLFYKNNENLYSAKYYKQELQNEINYSGHQFIKNILIKYYKFIRDIFIESANSTGNYMSIFKNHIDVSFSFSVLVNIFALLLLLICNWGLIKNIILNLPSEEILSIFNNNIKIYNPLLNNLRIIALLIFIVIPLISFFSHLKFIRKKDRFLPLIFFPIIFLPIAFFLAYIGGVSIICTHHNKGNFNESDINNILICLLYAYTTFSSIDIMVFLTSLENTKINLNINEQIYNVKKLNQMTLMISLVTFLLVCSHKYVSFFILFGSVSTFIIAFFFYVYIRDITSKKINFKLIIGVWLCTILLFLTTLHVLGPKFAQMIFK